MADDPRNPGAGAPSGAPAGGSIASQKLGPLPTWAWIGLAAGGAFIWFYARRSKSTEDSQPVTNTVTVPGADSADVQGQLATIYSQIRDIQGGNSTPSPGGDVDADLSGTFANLPPAASPDPSQPHTTGPLKAGASLENIATLLWGDPNGARWLYWTNEKVIEDAAQKAGYGNSQGGRILVPGIDLVVPPPVKRSPNSAQGTVSPTS